MLALCIVGSAETVRQRLVDCARALRFGSSSISAPHHRTVKNMELFATEVMPRVRAELGGKAPAAARAA